MFRPLLSVVLCLLMALPVWAEPPGDQTAGEVKAMIPDASRNAHPLAIKDTLEWNDLLQTNAKGRVRAGLIDGSILSLGSNSQLKVVQHDATSQQTLIDLNYGKLRNQVVKITRPGGKYEVRTPNAVIGVIGTDFYVAFANGRTTVICYEGLLTVTPEVGAGVTQSGTPGAATTNSVTVPSGHMVVIGPKDEQGENQLVVVPAAMTTASMKDTDIPERTRSHRTRNIVIAAMVAVAGLTVGLTQANSSSKPCGCR